MDESIYGYGLPPNLSTHGAQIDQLITVLHYFMFILFIGWGLYFIYCLIKFRARPGHKALGDVKHFKFTTYLEVGIVLFEVFLLIGLSFPIWKKVKNEFPPEGESTVVRVVAEQFAWNIHYPGPDRIFGRTDISLMDPVDNALGLDREGDPHAKDDIVTINDMHIPVSRPIIAHISSKDVIHSFGIPVLRVKQDAVPGMRIPIWFEATQTGKFEIACAQLCGVGHTTMRGFITIDTEQDYNQWVASFSQPAQTEDAHGS